MTKIMVSSTASFFIPSALPLRAIECFSLAIRLSQALLYFLSFFPLPPSHTGTMSLPWLGGCNLLQAAGQAERSPSYLDRGSPGKSYQRGGVFKYGRNCSNHFLLSLQPPTLKGPAPYLPNFLQPPHPPLSQFPDIFPLAF